MYQYGKFDGHAGAMGVEAPFGAAPALRRPAFGTRAQDYRAPRSFDLVVDLGQRIGSLEWFRGFGTCIGLCYAAWSLGPAYAPIRGSTPAPLGEAQRSEAQALAIKPLALGADAGRRMAPTEAVQPLTDTPERPILNLRATLGRGDGFTRVLERAGVGAAEAAIAADLVREVVPTDNIRPGTVMDLVLGRRPDRRMARPLDGLSFRARFDLRIEIVRVGNGLQLRQVPISVDDTPLRIQGVVGASLYRSARAAGVPARVVEAYIRALSGQISVPSGLSGADRFDIIIEHRRAATGETEKGQLLYAGLDRSGSRDLQMMPWETDGRTQWFEASGVGRETGGFVQPVPGAVSSNFGLRMHPILGYARMHRGVDFRAAHGTPILAATDGRVSFAGWAGGYGRQVRISHAGGLLTSYSHMSRVSVSPGQTVREGQVIGTVGSTGLSTGPHLHYEVHRNGVAVNPRSIRFSSRSQLAGEELAAFRNRLRGLLGTPVGGATRQADAGAAPARAAAR